VGVQLAAKTGLLLRIVAVSKIPIDVIALNFMAQD